MRRETLLDFFDDFAHREASFLAYDDGYRHRDYSYAHVAAAARRFAGRLAAAGLVKGDKVIIWSENRPEWIVALWGCLLRGVVIVPIDYRASFAFLTRVAGMVSTGIVLVGHDIEPDADTGSLALWPLDTLLDLPPAVRSGSTTSGAGAIDHPDARPVPISRDDVAEIIFTSGATAEPKGVVITHRNILANILPIEQEVAKYRKWARPFHPIRFLNLLPLSHMFGQALATFVPPMLSGQVIFMRGYNPEEIVRQIKRQRVSILVSVPKLLDVLRDHLLRQFPETATPPPANEKWMRRWWRYRQVHRAFGLKFWSFIVGAAPLDPALEEFMGRLGFLVVQGYGLTETAPIVTLNHPFSAKKGSVGKPIHGVEVKIGDDGEILVKGDNVTRGYFGDGDETRTAFEDGWLHTGDIGGVDADGRLVHPRPQEGNDRHARRAQRVSGRCGKGAPDNRRRPRCCSGRPCFERRGAGPRGAAPRPDDLARGRRPSGQRTARRSPEGPQCIGVAGGGASPHRGHAQAATPRAQDVGGRGRGVGAAAGRRLG